MHACEPAVGLPLASQGLGLLEPVETPPQLRCGGGLGPNGMGKEGTRRAVCVPRQCSWGS